MDGTLQSLLAVAADRAEELGIMPLASHLRMIAAGEGSTFQPFITGSRMYGTPREDSDLDLAFVSEETTAGLLRGTGLGGGSGSDSIRFGPLNIILLSPSHFQAWEDATNDLAHRRPVSRDEAVREIKARVKASVERLIGV